MTPLLTQTGWLRPRTGHHHRVTYVELLFDLVFVFAVTQVSHALLHHPGALGLVQAAIMLLALWWAWVYTAWATNWLDPDRVSVRLMLFAVMLAGLIMSAAIPRAFDRHGAVFALAYAAIQVGRTAFTWAAIPSADAALKRNFLRILIWLAGAAPFWIAGGLAEGSVRTGLWLTALALEYASPAVRFRLPFLGASAVTDWQVEGAHMAERCGLFVIIALGESILLTGSVFSEGDWSTPRVLALLSAFGGTLAMWWIYFHRGEAAGSASITGAADPGRLARIAYTYQHLPIIAGIIVSAVADELVMAHPDGHAGGWETLMICGGPLLFLAGSMLFKHSIRGFYQLSHRAGCAALLLAFPLSLLVPPLGLSLLTTAILVLVAIWEAISLRA